MCADVPEVLADVLGFDVFLAVDVVVDVDVVLPPVVAVAAEV